MTLYINRILDDEYITNILNYIFINRPVSIIRTISRTGRNKSSVHWLYYVNEITGQFSTFISFQDLLQNFWVWLESINLFAIALFQRQKISEVVWHFVKVGDHIFSPRNAVSAGTAFSRRCTADFNMAGLQLSKSKF